jgi:putative acetyltransferase
MKVRYELDSDIDSVRAVNSQAFPTSSEANLVDALRSSAKCISLVAEIRNEIVGHILFSPVSINGYAGTSIVGLAPLAVLPKEQNNGVGSLLVERGLVECKANNFDAVAVLGHPNYYPRFGFQPSTKFSIKSEYDVPDEVFMIQELTPESLIHVEGIIKYHDAFKNV